jgi:hypothetical protein
MKRSADAVQPLCHLLFRQRALPLVIQSDLCLGNTLAHSFTRSLTRSLPSIHALPTHSLGSSRPRSLSGLRFPFTASAQSIRHQLSCPVSPPNTPQASPKSTSGPKLSVQQVPAHRSALRSRALSAAAAAAIVVIAAVVIAAAIIAATVIWSPLPALAAPRLLFVAVPATMVAQRRYSVTGQTPPDDAEALKALSPKLQALDTSVQTGSCETTCNPEHARGRTTAQPGTIVRTSSKRSATQLPSPSSPSCEVPPKMARYRLGYPDTAVDIDTDTDSDSTDVSHERCEREEEDWAMGSPATLTPPTPGYSLSLSPFTLPEAASLEHLHLHPQAGSDDEGMEAEDFALSPLHSRHHSLDDKLTLQRDWAAFKQLNALLKPEAVHVEDAGTRPDDDNGTKPSLTLLSLPPEIRYKIYHDCEKLIADGPLTYCISTFKDEKQHVLASISRQVRSEALAIFYSYNHWIIKTEFRMMYEAFQLWMVRLGDFARHLRVVTIAVRGSLFKAWRPQTQGVMLNGQLFHAHGARAAAYSPPDGDASFKINLSEKYAGGTVHVVRNDGTHEAGEKARVQLSKLVYGLWEKRRTGALNAQDWVDVVDAFMRFVDS